MYSKPLVTISSCCKMHLLIDNLPLELSSMVTQFKKKIQATFVAQFLWSGTRRVKSIYHNFSQAYSSATIQVTFPI